jgi:outer membrane lipoprotein-sorting protein
MGASLLAAALLSGPALAETPEEKGLAIAVEADQRDSGWGSSQAEMKMVLKNRNGDESVRDVRVRTLEVEGDGDKGLSIFDKPADVKGTAFLSFSHAKQPDDQWLYLPALKRVKRISSRNKSGPFMGSEFAYEDISSQEVDKYTYKYLRDEAVDGRDSFVVERFPTYENSGYTRQIAWIDAERYVPLKVEFYDRKNSLLKTLVSSGYQQYAGKYWRADVMQMDNHQNGKSTTLNWSNWEFGVGLDEGDFDQNALKRIR